MFSLPRQSAHSFKSIRPTVSMKWTRKLLAMGMAASLVSIGLLNQAQANNCALDPTFGNGGIASTDFGGWDAATAAVLQPDNKIVAVGSTSSNQNSDVALARYNTDGSLDPSFDSDGMTITDIHRAQDRANDVLIQPDGNIVAVGYSLSAPNRNLNFALVRYLGDPVDYAPTLDSLTISQQMITGGLSLEGTVTLCGPAPAGGIKVILKDNLDAALMRPSIIVPGGRNHGEILY